MPDAWFAVAAFPPAANGFEGGGEAWFPNPYANSPPWPPWFGAGGGGGVSGVSGYPRAGGGSHSEMSRTAILTPVIIATVALVGSAFLLVTYYRVFARYCSAWRIFRGVRRRRRGGGDGDGDYAGAAGGIEQGFLAIAANTGLDEAVVKKIPVYLYSEGFVSGSECAVCLGEFEDEDELRLLPKCGHAFHVACIDAWLRSHSNCPLCRAIVAAPAAAVASSGAGTRSQDEQQEQPQQPQQQQPELGSGETHQGELVLTLGVDSAETQDEDAPSIGAATAVEYRRSSSMRAADTSPDRGKELRRCHSVGSKPIKYESGELLREQQQQPGLGFVVLNIEVGSSSSSASSSSASVGGEGEENDGNSGGGGGGDRCSPLRKSSLLRAPASLMHGVFSLGLRKSAHHQNAGSHSEGGGA